MKVNNNCARRILIECEKIPYNNGLYIQDLCNKLMEYSNDDILNVLSFFYKNDYIEIVTKEYRMKHPLEMDDMITGLTLKGIENLDYIRNDNLWEEIINGVQDSKNLSILYFISLAKRIHISKQNKIFDIM